MITQQPEALRLAGFLDKLDVRTPDKIQNCVSASAELRRLHEVNAELLEALKEVVKFWDSITELDCVNNIHVQARDAIAKATGGVA